MSLDYGGILLDKSNFDGDWDYIYARRGTKSSVILTKYKCLKDGKLLPLDQWIIKSHYDTQYGTKLYREEKLNQLGI